MPDFRVVRFQPEHLEDIQRLWRHLYSEREIEQRTRIFEWFALGNPYADADKPPYYIMLDGEKVVGFHGHAPWPWVFAGERVPGFVCYDDMLDPDYRGQGLGKILLGGAAELRPEFAAALWHNEPNHRLYSKAGWSDFSDFVPWVRVFDPTPFLRGRLGPLAPVAGALGRVAITARDALRPGPRTAAYRFEDIERFGPEFDELFDALAPRFDAIVARDSTYLNWRFADKPFGRYEKIAARDADGRLAGYLVYRRRAAGADAEGEDATSSASSSAPSSPHYGMLFDFLADPEGDAFPALLAEAVKRLYRAGVTDVRVACTEPRFAEALEAQGFLKARRPLCFMILHHEGRVDPSWPESTRHWYLTYSDGDGDAWTTD